MGTGEIIPLITYIFWCFTWHWLGSSSFICPIAVREHLTDKWGPSVSVWHIKSSPARHSLHRSLHGNRRTATRIVTPQYRPRQIAFSGVVPTKHASFAMAVHSPSAISYASLSPIKPNPKSKTKTKPKLKPPPLSISTNRSSVDPVQVQHLFASCAHSCHRFPRTGPDGRTELVDLRKLRLALAHSYVVVSVFCKARFLEGEQERQDSGALGYGLGDLFGDSDQRLVGFGRAVSDCGLTASIHDVVVKSSILSV